MGFKTLLLGIGPELPREARRRHPEGGPEAAALAARRWFPGQISGALGTADMAHGGYPLADEPEVWVSTHGPTVVFGGEDMLRDRDRLTAEATGAGLSVWQLVVHSVVGHSEFSVHGPEGVDREVKVDDESTVTAMEAMSFGSPLPFERPYWAGEHPLGPPEAGPYPLPFHPLQLGEAALAWMFGVSGEGAPTDAVQRSLGVIPWIDGVAMHGFRLSAAVG